MIKKFQNPIEMEGLKNAHMRDGAAVVQFLVWLDKQVTICQLGFLLSLVYNKDRTFHKNHGS